MDAVPDEPDGVPAEGEVAEPGTCWTGAAEEAGAAFAGADGWAVEELGGAAEGFTIGVESDGSGNLP
ncbi:MAG: hypothetical protein IT343_01325 [Candidatus Melainabacteria bacterium]|nr:hypothetical protein [Candidatus Melainabacteria bacterium]